MRTWLRRLALDRREARAWALYDWGNSAFWTTVVTAVFPLYYLELVPELDAEAAQQRFLHATTLALVVSALLAPVLGTLADLRSLKKTLLAAFALLGAASTAALFRALPGDGTFALWCFALANVGAVGSVVFYDALLPHVAREDEMDRLSASGYALGYLGGGLCLALNLAWILMPARFGLPAGGTVEEGHAARAARVPVRRRVVAVLHAAGAAAGERAAALGGVRRRGSGAALVRTTFERLRETVPRAAPLPAGVPAARRVPALQRRHPDHHPHGRHVRERERARPDDRAGHVPRDPVRRHPVLVPVRRSGGFGSASSA
jgi:UMF1 family MFS transporter